MAQVSAGDADATLTIWASSCEQRHQNVSRHKLAVHAGHVGLPLPTLDIGMQAEYAMHDMRLNQCQNALMI